MTTAKTGMFGGTPQLKQGKGNPEAVKYMKMWEKPEYRKVAPGEMLAQTFLNIAKPEPGSEVIDFGCGTGRGALMLALLGKMKVTMIDFVRNSLDPEIKQALKTQAKVLKFLQADIEKPIPMHAKYGYCTDVMEHIPEDKIDLVLDNILLSAQHVFFSISTGDDVCGKMIDEKLHVSVHPYAWWLEKFSNRDCVIHWSQESGTNCFFYISAWKKCKEIIKDGKLNTDLEIIKNNVSYNIKQGWQQVIPYPTNDVEIMMLGGGPTMIQFQDDIKKKRAEGVKLITLNGTYNWCLDNNLIPSAQVVTDAREFNKRFTKPIVDGCKYFICSQVHPDVFIDLPKDRTYIWHTCSDLNGNMLKEQYPDGWHVVPGGSTVLLRAIPLFRMLGFKRMHLYGCDSCLMDNKHHAYSQPENDNGQVIPITVNPGGKVFYCNPWMISQAEEMMSLIKFFGDEIELEIYGDGLLAQILKEGARLSEKDLV